MEEERSFNAKRARAQKLKRDKVHTKPHRPVNNESNQTAQIVSKTKLIETSRPCSAISINKLHVNDVDSSQFKVYSKRTLQSNWDRYERELDSIDGIIDTDVCGPANFEELIKNVPVSGGHFKLKHEYDWDKERAEIQAPWFQLDLEKLNSSLSSIPFFERHGLDSNLFSEEKLNQMIAQTSQKTLSLKDTMNIIEVCKSKSCEKSLSDEIIPASKVSQISGVTIDTKKSECTEDDELDSLLSFDEPPHTTAVLAERLEASSGSLIAEDKAKLSSENPSPSPVTPSSTKQLPPTSLDDWLDSILGE